MNDVQRIAEERAAQPRTKPIGSSMQSEHRIAKNAVVQQINALDGTRIQKIDAVDDRKQSDRKRSVVAYCRVSTDEVEQAVSIAMQVKAYREKINANPDWINKGIYVDDGFSGTNTEHRMGFQQMYQDAIAGKFDLILTKSVSRLARNLTDCIKFVKEMQNLDPPVDIQFEQENFSTLSQTSSVILFVLAMVAQEESHMKSEAINLSIEWRFSHGRFMTPRLFGYDLVKVPDGFGGFRKVLQINEAEARVVEWMYSRLLNGASTVEIAATLNDLEIPTGGRKKDGTPNMFWTPQRVAAVLRNEKHCGDVLARKTYTKDYISHKAVKNKGKKPKYYLSGHHEAIVSRAVWNAAQRILNSHRYGHSGKYAPMRIIDKGALAGFVSMNRSWGGFDTEDYFRASQIAMGLLDEELDADLDNEQLPESGHRIKGTMDDNGVQRVARELSEEEKKMKAELEGKTLEDHELEEYERQAHCFQVLSGSLLPLGGEPLMRVTPKSIGFSKKCLQKLDGYESVEFLFNPVERMVVIRPGIGSHPHRFPWSQGPKGATSIAKTLYESLLWDEDNTYTIHVQVLDNPKPHKGEPNCVLLFDLDNYIGQADSKTETSAPKEEAKPVEMKREGKSYYYPPDEEDPQELKEKEERQQKINELKKKIFGTPTHEHSSELRWPMDSSDSDQWDMLIEARPLDEEHAVEEEKVDEIFRQIQADPPRAQTKKEYPLFAEGEVTDKEVDTNDRIEEPSKEPPII